MNSNKYVLLADDFTMKHSISASILYCLRNGAIYELPPDQVGFLQLLNGTSTLGQVIKQYSKKSKPDVLRLLNHLEKIEALKFTDKPTLKIIQRNKVFDKRLESVHLEASSKCNMKCVHCYQAKYLKTKEELSLPEILNVLDGLQTMQVNNVGISGGEPLMMPRLAEILKTIEKKDMRISALFSNGLLINEDFIRMIKTLRSRFSLFVSLDSIPGKTLSFRGFSNKNSRQIIEQIINNIKLLVSAGINVVINTVVNTENIGYLNEMYDLIKDLKVESWRIGFPKMTPEFKIHSDKFNVKWSSVADSCFFLLQRHLANGMPFHLQIEYLFREELFKQGLQTLSDRDFVCDYEGRRTECCIKPNGDVVSCAYCSDLPLGNIRKSSIRDIWYSPQMERVKTIKIGDVVECRKCKLRSLCGTGCRANAYFLHGDFYNAKDDYACLAVGFFQEKIIPLLKEYNLID